MSVIILRGDAAHLPLPDESADLLVTSPPYFGLRSYVDGGEHYAGQIGSEATPRAYLEALWACTAEWVRVLKPSGSLFVNLGDKYDSGTTAARVNPGTVKDGQGQGWHQETPRVSLGRPKSLLGMPWRYALGCIDNLGLILRAEIIWDKPNGLPESVTDRVRRCHEQVFHFTRSPRYFSAVDEVREEASGYFRQNAARATPPGVKPRTLADACNPLGKLPGSVREIPSAPLTAPAHLGVDHFAAYPPKLVRRIIQGWSPREVCTACGEGRRPVVERVTSGHDNSPYSRTLRLNGGMGGTAFNRMKALGGGDRITGYACVCPQPDALTTPGVVVDPFGGTGTTALVADVLGRTGVTVDRSADYCRLAQWRTGDPGERARALGVPKPPPVSDGQGSLFDGLEAS